MGQNLTGILVDINLPVGQFSIIRYAPERSKPKSQQAELGENIVKSIACEKISGRVPALVLALLILSGCSAFRPHSQMVNVVCEPSDAVLTVNGQRYSSPAQVSAKRNRDVSIQCHKAGYHPAQRTVGHHFNGTGALDAAGTLVFLLPGIGLFTPGAWSLDEEDVHIQLYPQ